MADIKGIVVDSILAYSQVSATPSLAFYIICNFIETRVFQKMATLCIFYRWYISNCLDVILSMDSLRKTDKPGSNIVP